VNRHPGRAAGPGMRQNDPWDGLLLVDKPSGMTSHDVVDAIRDHFGFRKVGHGGTLDPMATGLLVMLLGRGTKLSNYIIGSDKVYEGTLCLGRSTDSQDCDGKVLAEKDPSGVTREALDAEMKKRTGDLMQTPPMVSAVKHEGTPLYKLARKGQEIVREPRLIHIYEFALLDFTPPRASFRLRCTKGTYVRTLGSDIGDALGCGAFLESLRRTRSGDLDLAEALPLNTVLALSADDLIPYVIPMESFRMRSGPA
jgi:tRNA pseudouridine55 synthase